MAQKNISPIFNRAQLLLGTDVMDRLASLRVIIFGVGGVGSWCAEGLVRSGIGHVTIVDSDRVCITNVNRQLQATSLTVGMVKVDALKARLLEINPSADIETHQQIFSAETAETFNLDSYDFVIDCIDSLQHKVQLIEIATRSSATLLSSMGAALKVDPTRIRVAEFWKVQGCPLAKMLRKRFRRLKIFPAKKFLCVYSDEVLPNRGTAAACGSDRCVCPKNADAPGDTDLANHEWCSSKAVINGSLMHITSIFGLTLAGLVIQEASRS
ncbi:MAG: tRNA threonylcarbamoyladenosine dehydratase [Muribaculaceae bacterium]|nr:tRNA threonylcarbamoyladenosine dehydratase [Muribaculaceae bacterium]